MSVDVRGKLDASEIMFLESIHSITPILNHDQLYVCYAEGGGAGGNVATAEYYFLPNVNAPCEIVLLSSSFTYEEIEWRIDGIEANNGILNLSVSAYKSGDAHCCPSLHGRATATLSSDNQWSIAELSQEDNSTIEQ